MKCLGQGYGRLRAELWSQLRLCVSGSSVAPWAGQETHRPQQSVPVSRGEGGRKVSLQLRLTDQGSFWEEVALGLGLKDLERDGEDMQDKIWGHRRRVCLEEHAQADGPDVATGTQQAWSGRTGAGRTGCRRRT